ncbi:hypothetical protein PCE1_003698 [Barthelona sp. PCE]
MAALREIRDFQASEKLLLRKLPFQKLVRRIASDHGSGIRFQKTALLALQESAESYLTSLFEQSLFCAVHAKRVTLFLDDMRLALRIRNDPFLVGAEEERE